MALSTGTRLGPYEILSAIGAGGMGEVYRAKDTRLERIVAVKVLPAVLAADPQFRERFDREAKSISALNHPHICALYDVGEGYLVMEYLEGETLAERIGKGALPLSEALKVGIEVASALDRAHRQGIVHRDLKPGNVMLTKAGAKLLDFGLAKTGPAGAVSGAYVTAMPTATAPVGGAQGGPLTAQGTILGTFQYMAPEQVEGDEADARTDIFAFGAVLYEMLTGRKAFTGKSQASLLGAILKDEPPAVSQLQPAAPPVLDHVIRTCLAKDRDARFQTSHDLLLQLRWIAEGGSAAGVAAPVVAHRRRRERLAWIAVAALGVAFLGAAAIAVMHLRETPPPAEPITFTISSPEGGLFFGATPQFALSPDGRQVVFAAAAQGTTYLWVRPLSSLTARLIPGTEQPSYPFWSPDSRFVGFFSSGKLKKVQLSGGMSTALCDASNGRGGTWNRDNVIVFSPSANAPLQRVASAGGIPTTVTATDKNASSHRWPVFLSDGRHFIFFAGTPGISGEIRTGSLDGADVSMLVSSDSNAEYAAGHLIFSRAGSLMAQPFDEAARQTKGDPFPIADQVITDNAVHAPFAVSATGILAYARGSVRPIARLTWFDRAGKLLGTAGEPAEYFNLALSPDERRVAVSMQSGTPPNRDIWLIDLARAGTPSRFTFDPAGDGVPVWSPTGTQVGFESNRSGSWNTHVKAASGSGQDELVLKSDTNHYLTDWSRDGRTLVYSDLSAGTGFDLWTLSLPGTRKPTPFLQTQFNEDNAVFSPDGRWIAYDSNEAGRLEVYVRPFPVAAGQFQVSRGGGREPAWRGDGKELYYLTLDSKMMAAGIDTTKDFEATVPQLLFPTNVIFTGNRHQYAVTRDGKRFLVNSPEQKGSPAAITVVVNWLATIQK